jgi:hypothetical protein
MAAMCRAPRTHTAVVAVAPAGDIDTRTSCYLVFRSELDDGKILVGAQMVDQLARLAPHNVCADVARGNHACSRISICIMQW